MKCDGNRWHQVCLFQIRKTRPRPLFFNYHALLQIRIQGSQVSKYVDYFPVDMILSVKKRARFGFVVLARALSRNSQPFLSWLSADCYLLRTTRCRIALVSQAIFDWLNEKPKWEATNSQNGGAALPSGFARRKNSSFFTLTIWRVFSATDFYKNGANYSIDIFQSWI